MSTSPLLALAHSTGRIAVTHIYPVSCPYETRYHSPAAHKKLELMSKNAPDAPVEADVHRTELAKDFQKLIDRSHEIGLYKPNYADEVLKAFVTLAPVCANRYIMCIGCVKGGGFQ